MGEEVQELKHVCKVCNRTFPCGRSLGGHMRSHVINTAESDQNLTKKKLSSLRENPKKAFRFTDSNGETLPRNKLCKECGRGFPSWKALFGHMKCHSERFSNTNVEEEVEEEEEEENSWTSSASQSDNPKEGSSRRGTRARRYMMGTANSLHIANNINNASSSSVPVIEQDQEEVAMCLIMLSKDVGNKRSGLNYVDESSDHNFELLQPKSSTIPRNLESSVLGALSSKFDTSGVSRNGLLRNDHKTNNKDSKLGKNLMKERRFDQSAAELCYGDWDSGKRSKFECTTCNKTFHSYQALGGHRASHKKIKGCSFASKIDSSAENSIETAEISPAPKSHNNEDPIDEEEDASYVVLSKKINNNKRGGHQCPICSKVFSSGQALGGHKRSHLICGVGAGPKMNQTIVIHQKPNVPEIRDLLDLNLPAPVEEESSSGFKPWWVADNLKHDQLFGLLS